MKSLILQVVLLGHAAAGVLSAEKRCAACHAIVGELDGQWNDKSKNMHKTVDLRSRLNSKGERTGKVVGYANSRIRAEDIVDSFCGNDIFEWDEEKEEYYNSKDKFDREKNTFGGKNNKIDIMNLDVSSMTPDKARGKDFVKFCDTFVELNEDDLVDGLYENTPINEIDSQVCTRICKKVKKKPKKRKPKVAKAEADAEIEAEEANAEKTEL